eukprot:SAG22_NODE_779_length_7272_cov_146.237418_10_plen_154_part_00
MSMTPLGMYSLYQEHGPRFAQPNGSDWQDVTQLLLTLEGHSSAVRSVAFDASGGTLASGSGDQMVKLWDVASGECLRTLEGHSGFVYSVAFDASGGTLASGSYDRTVKLVGSFRWRSMRAAARWRPGLVIGAWREARVLDDVVVGSDSSSVSR